MKRVIYISLLNLACFFYSVKVFAQATNKIDSVGNVGIGTVYPESRFEVVAGESGRIIFSGTSNNVNANSPKLSFWGLGGQTSVGGPAIQAISTGVWGGHRLAIFQHPTSSGDYSTENETVSILDDGRVGFGTVSPQLKLEIQGLSGDGLRISNSSNTGYYTDILTNLNDVTTFQIKVQGNSVFQAGGTGNTVISSLGTNKDIILSPNGSGKLGIGTGAPTEKLSVNGNISTKKVIVTQLGWSDYVFDKKYKLRSLTSLEEYINQHKHLPEIPTAKEVEERGISVGDNQALLLKKIEELTLYVIQQQKEIETLKKQIQKK